MKKITTLILVIIMASLLGCGKSTSDSTTADSDATVTQSTVIQVLSVVPVDDTSKISAHIKNISEDQTTIDSYIVRAMLDNKTDPVAQITVEIDNNIQLASGQKTVLSTDLGSTISSHHDYDYLRFTFNVTLTHSETTIYNTLTIDY
jgi:hypothetical protein